MTGRKVLALYQEMKRWKSKPSISAKAEVSEGGRPETTSSFEILLKEPLELGKSYQVTKEGYGEKELLMSGVFSTSAFEKAYHYDGDLGALYEKEGTTFWLWAPTATKVTLNWKKWWKQEIQWFL